MRTGWVGRIVAVGCGLVASLAPLGADETRYVRFASEWRYHRGLAEASSPDTAAWRALDFDDSAWASGGAPFGFGTNEGVLGTDLGALDPPMRGSYSTLFLRRSFEVLRPEDIVRLDVRMVCDDGFILWLNGVEVLRDNAPEFPTFDGAAPRSVEAGDPIAFDLPDPVGYIREGRNVIAVQAFNQSRTNTDFKIDVELIDPLGPDVTPPEVDSVVPPPGMTVRKADRIEILFSEDVTGVDAGDLLLGGTPATGLQGSGRGPYVFSLQAPASGPVEVRWAEGHGIADFAPLPNAFRGGAWSYAIDPAARPAAIAISEFAALNRSSSVPVVRDEDGEFPDWIEIHNRGSTAANLAGWSLTDDPDEPGKWTFPPLELDPGARLVVFASGKDRRSALDRNLHTSFQLSADGEYLGLFIPESPRVAATEFAPRYPEQRLGASYGIDDERNVGYFAPPTPGAPNGLVVSPLGFVADPRFTPVRGFHDAPVDVEIYCPTPGARIWYTTDGREPDPSTGQEYTGPVRVAGTPERGVVTLRAAATKGDYLPSRTVTHTYLFPEHILAQPARPPGFPAQWGNATVTTGDYAMDPRVVAQNPAEALRALRTIPTLSVVLPVDDLFGKTSGIYSNPNLEGLAWERAASAELILPDGSTAFQANCGLRIQGGSSTEPWKSQKLSLRLFFKGDYGPSKLTYPLFPDSAVGTFDTIVLDAHLNLTWTHPGADQQVRSQYVRDAFVSDLQNAFGSLANRSIFAHLYLDGLYWGLYEVHERPDASFAAEHLGGEKEEYDVFRHEYGLLVDGDRKAWTDMFTLARRGLTTIDPYLAIQDYLDVRDLADYMLVHLWAGNDDWPRHNWYAARRRVPGAGFRFFSWDSEHVLKDVAINQTAVNLPGSPAELYALLRQNPEWRLLFADRAHRQFFGGPLYVDPASPAWDEEHPERNAPAALYMERIREIDPAIRLESARWGDNRRPAQPYTRDVEWLNELRSLQTSYFPRRSGIVLNQLRAAGLYPRVGAPVFSHPGGRIDPGLALSLELPDGTAGSIYYTTDGSDPRVFGSGFVSAEAKSYGGPIAIQDTTRVKARTLSGDVWSAIEEALFTVASPLESLAVTEIHYHPADAEDSEFLELHNAGLHAIDLSGLRLSNGVDFVFREGAAMPPDGYLVVVSDAAAFAARHPGVPVAGVWEGRLDNGGEKVTLTDAAGSTVLSVDYGDEGSWPLGPDGFGWSLVILDELGDPDDPGNWRASARVHGSPGARDLGPEHGGVVIHEVLTRAASPFEDAIELANLSDRAIDLGGWFLSDRRDDASALRRSRIPDGVAIPAGGFAVVYERDLGFGLSSTGDGAYLASADPAGNLTGHIVGHSFGGASQGVSFGRIERTVGPDFGPLEATSFGADRPASLEEFRSGRGAPNAGPRVGPVVIHEIHYHPLPGEDEFVELANLTDSVVDVGGWTLDGILDGLGVRAYAFPAGTRIAAGGLLLVVGVEPGFFRARYGIDPAVPIVGPFGGALDNSGETLRLERPFDGPDAAGATILVDRVRYDDREPWPVEADGEGPSLERVRAGEHGNDPVDWMASLESGGSPGLANGASGPGVNQRPVPAFETVAQAAPRRVLLDASRARDPDGTIRAYEWTFGDGTSGAGRTVLHDYLAAGSWSVRLRVVDDDGAESETVRVVTVSEGSEPAGGWQLPGDGTQDGLLNLTDPIALLSHLFLGAADPLGCGDAAPTEGATAVLLDVNGDEAVDIADAVHVLNYLFLGGPAPVLGAECVRIPGCPDACGR